MLVMMGLTVSAECEDYDDDLYELKAFGDTKQEWFFVKLPGFLYVKAKGSSKKAPKIPCFFENCQLFLVPEGGSFFFWDLGYVEVFIRLKCSGEKSRDKRTTKYRTII